MLFVMSLCSMRGLCVCILCCKHVFASQTCYLFNSGIRLLPSARWCSVQSSIPFLCCSDSVSTNCILCVDGCVPAIVAEECRVAGMFPCKLIMVVHKKTTGCL